jgi:polyribonucleotide nucleotidyltransferase
MLEASAENLSQQDFQKCVKEGVKRAQPIIQAIKQMRDMYGRAKRELSAPAALDPDIEQAMTRYNCFSPISCVSVDVSRYVCH